MILIITSELCASLSNLMACASSHVNATSASGHQIEPLCQRCPHRYRQQEPQPRRDPATMNVITNSPLLQFDEKNLSQINPCFSLMKTILSQINPCFNLMKTMLSQLNICLPSPGRGSAMRAETNNTRISDACRDQQPWLSAPPPNSRIHAAMCTDRLWAFMISTVLTMLLLLS